jgi:hypothetical protein
MALIGSEALKIGGMCITARGLIARKRASLNGLAIQTIQRAAAHIENVVELFPEALEQLAPVSEQVQAAIDEVSALTQDGLLHPFRSNKILDRLEETMDLLPTMENETQSLSSKLSEDLAAVLADAEAAMLADDHTAARAGMNQCLAILRGFDFSHKVITQIRRGRAFRLLTEAQLFLRQAGPVVSGAVHAFLPLRTEAVAFHVRLYRPDGQLVRAREWAGQRLSWEALDPGGDKRSERSLANGVYLLVTEAWGAEGRRMSRALQKVVIHR